MSRTYYNEWNKHAAQWIREMIHIGLLPAGDVDDRDIRDISPSDLRGYSSCHFFAGIGGWAYAGRLAGVPDDWQWWTGSAPCQPFSVAGKGKGVDDSRHLWPDFFRLISACRPTRIMGEQVAGKAGRAWFDGVSANLEGDDYAIRAVDIPALAVNAPHIRNRLYWCASRRDGSLGDGDGEGMEIGMRERGDDGEEFSSLVGTDGSVGDGYPIRQRQSKGSITDVGGRAFYADAEWLKCSDGKSRRSKPGLRLLVDGFPGRVDAWRGLGNAIVAPLAAEVIVAFRETEHLIFA